MPSYRHPKQHITARWHQPVIVLAGLLLVACSHTNRGDLQNRAIEYDQQAFQVVSIDLRQNALALYWRNRDTLQPFQNIDTLKQWGDKHGRTLVFATNAGIYDSRHAPLGLYVEDGKTLVPLNTAHGDPKRGNFSLLPNGIFSIDKRGNAHVQTTRAWQHKHEPPRWATQSGPMLVTDGHINPHFTADSTSIKWRSGVCARSAHKVVFAISKTPVNFHTFARLFRDKLGCRDALYLDGTLSQFYVNGHQYGPPGFMVKPWAGMFGVFESDGSRSGQ